LLKQRCVSLTLPVFIVYFMTNQFLHHSTFWAAKIGKNK
jgi:hypothetical protein